MSVAIQHFFHSDSSTLTYVVSCSDTKVCIVIDPVLDFDISSGEVDRVAIDEVIGFIKDNELSLVWILETHAHADHATAAYTLKQSLGGKIACGKGITEVQASFKSFFNLDDIDTSGAVFDKLLKDNEELIFGHEKIRVLATPGHTPDSVTYIIGNNAFIGDTLFMPDSGSARCDFPKGSAAQLYQSIQKIYSLGDDTTLFMCHDYMPNDRSLRYSCSVKEQKELNIQVGAQVCEADYVKVREQRDSVLNVPRLIYPSLQFNIRAGQLPPADTNGSYYFKMPLLGTQKLI